MTVRADRRRLYERWFCGRASGLQGDSAWIVGQVVDVGEEYIALEYWIPVIPETVGEYTGIKDKNGVRVFVGDVVSYSNCVGDYQGIVRLGEYEQDGSSNVYPPSKCNGFFVERTAPILQKWEDDPTDICITCMRGERPCHCLK